MENECGRLVIVTDNLLQKTANALTAALNDSIELKQPLIEQFKYFEQIRTTFSNLKKFWVIQGNECKSLAQLG